jgi:hypothetical protein
MFSERDVSKLTHHPRIIVDQNFKNISQRKNSNIVTYPLPKKNRRPKPTKKRREY